MRKTKTPGSVIFGQEPKFSPSKITDENYNHVILECLDWYGNYGGFDDDHSRRNHQKEWIKDWALNNGFRKRDVYVPNQGISTIAALTRIAEKGFPLKEEHQKVVSDRLKEWKKDKPKPKKEDKKQKELLAKMKYEKELSEVLAFFDVLVDESMRSGKIPSASGYTGKVSLKMANDIKDTLKYEYDHLKEDYKTGNVSDYAMSKREIKKLITLYENIFQEIDGLVIQGKITRKRNAKKRPASAQIRKLQYQPVYKEYNMVSIDAEKVIGATVLYVFDTRKRLLRRFVSSTGITVTGTTLKNCTGTQKTIRKPEKQLAKFSSFVQVKCQKVFDKIKAVEKPTTGRLNKDCILLKAF